MFDGFFGIGFWEILLILVITLALLGPRRLPEIASRLGVLFRRLKRASVELTTALTREVEGTPVRKDENPLDSLKKAAYDLKSSLSGEVDNPPQHEDNGSRGEAGEHKAR